MARLYVGNFDFEHRLTNPGQQLPAKLDRINAELALSWLAIADEGDYIWTPQPVESSFFEQTTLNGMPHVNPVVSFNSVPRGVECIPWGWTDDLRRLCDAHGWHHLDPLSAAVRAGNSRRFSAGLEREWQVGLDGAHEVHSLHQLAELIADLGPVVRWVVKAEFGMSGRERLLGCGELTQQDCKWAFKRIESDGAVFLEPWVERLDEVGIQLEVPRAGSPKMIGVTPLLVDDRGQYSGSWFTTGEPEAETWAPAIEVALNAAQRLQELGYFGPVGIDAMRYRAPDGTIRIRPLQDINARWTMGRLSLGWRRLLCPGERAACWRHDPRGTNDLDTHRLARIISTSPERVGNVATHHQSYLLIR